MFLFKVALGVVSVKILHWMLSGNDEQRENIYNETPRRSAFHESRSGDVPNKNDNGLQRQGDPIATKLNYYEHYPNVSVSDITRKQPTASTIQPQAPSDTRPNTSVSAVPAYNNKSLERTSEVSQNSKNLKITGEKPKASNLHPQAAVDKMLNTSAPTAPACDKKSLERIQKVSQNSKSSCHGQTASASKPVQSSTKPTLSPHPFNLENPQGKRKYTLVQKNASPTYKIPEHIEDLIRKDIVPEVLKKPLSQSTYKDYFATLLYAEDFYIEKWNGFLLENVTLELEDAEICKREHKNRNHDKDDEGNNKTFIKFQIDCIPEKRPFLLSRDFVFAQPLGSKVEQFQGIIYRVVKSNIVLAEFNDDFYCQHKPTRKYNVSFSFNRVCLKRAHQAIESASDSLFKHFIFPMDSTPRNCFSPRPLLHCNSELNSDQRLAVAAILSLEAAPPYLVEDCGAKFVGSIRLRSVVVESVLQIYQSRNPVCRILICAPTNRTCDELMKSLKKKIPESRMFRANAAFRERDDVPEDILPSCRYTEDKDCFSCPPLHELLEFRVIFSTFMSSVRLRDEGISAGHFSHIFLVDASSAIEPEAMVPLASLASAKTTVVVAGISGEQSRWVRSDIARRNGLKISYFERLRKSQQYNCLYPKFITRV